MKNTFARLLVVLLLCTFVIGGFQTCAIAEEKVHLSIMCWGAASTLQAVVDDILETYPDFAERVEIEVLIGGGGDNEVAEKIRLSLASGEPCADIIQLNYTQIPEFAEAGALENLDDMFEGYWDNQTEAAQVLATYNGEKVAVANQINSKLFYYRKDIFDECGVDPTAWETVDDLIAGAKKIQETYPDYYIHNLSHSLGAQGYDNYLMFTAFDAKITDENGDYIVNTDPGIRKGFEINKKLLDSGICFDSDDWKPEWENGLASGQIIGELTSSWFKNFINGYAPEGEGKWTACLWPKEIAKGSEAGGSVYVIPIFAEHKEEAKEFLKYYRLEEAGTLATFEEPASRTPTIKSVFESDIMKGDHWYLSAGEPYWQIEYESYTNGDFSIFPYTPQAVAEMNMINSWSTRYYTGELTLDEMLNGLQDDLVMMIGNPYM